jgi:beta-carotene ketolase (CrtW type)
MSGPADRFAASTTPARQAAVGLTAAVCIVLAWLACHLGGVFFFPLEGWWIVAAPLLVAVQCWLNVGLFIIAHDAMHGSLAPFRPVLNRWTGRVCLILYAGFSYDRLLPKHFAHHRHAGTALDPDFDENHPSAFWPWYVAFFREYFGWRELLVLSAVLWIYLIVLGASAPNMLVFWALPAILSSLQLFLFGTYLPHRHGEVPFDDRHRARSNGYPPWLSLLTCFHFGYHHEHHTHPSTPWWRLPSLR